MDLKEYIKSLIRKELEETSATGAIGVGAAALKSFAQLSPRGYINSKRDVIRHIIKA